MAGIIRHVFSMVDWQGTGNIHRTDLYGIYNVVQNTQVSFPKELIISVLRDEFAKDSFYHYVSDSWGFPLTPDHTDLPIDAGLEDDVTTRLYIGEKWRHDVIYYPSILVWSGNTTYVPISMNRNKETVLSEATLVIDGYGNEKIFTTPVAFTLAGAWEGSVNIDIETRSIRSRDDLVELVTLICTDIRFEEFLRAGLLIKRVSASAPSEGEDRNEKLYKQTVTLEVRSEWRRHIPIGNVIDAINICVDFGNVQARPFVTAPNLTVNTTVDLLAEIQSL